ncbi:hypothetical protein IJ182_10260 [bacterium]|nr:hypothetical protein [bacterium]
MNILNAALNSTYTSYQPGLKQQSVMKPEKNNINFSANKKRVKAASIIGSALGIAAAVAGVYTMAKKGNPDVKLLNLNYEEKDVLLIGAGSVLGGLTGGLLSDENKNNVKPKLREASQQFFGSLMCPIGILAVANKQLEKSGFKLPQVNSSIKGAKAINVVLAALPKIVVTMGSLVAGMEIGNKIMNKVNNKIFKEEVKHDVHASDYLVHADDICLAANLLLKDAKSISVITSKALPATFILAGAKTGMQEAE